MTKGQFEEDRLPPLLGKEDLKLYAKELQDTYREVHKELEKFVGLRKLCITQQRRYKREKQEEDPDRRVLNECIRIYNKTKDDLDLNVEKRVNIKTRSQYHLRTHAERWAAIMENFQGRSEFCDKQRIKDVTDMHAKLSGILYQYVVEFERGSDIWGRGVDALERQGESFETLYENGREVIEIHSD